MDTRAGAAIHTTSKAGQADWHLAIALAHVLVIKSASISSSTLPDLKLLGLLGIASLFARGAACTINDVWDKEIDAQVERTKFRPLARGAVTPIQAITFYIGELLVFSVIFSQLDNTSRIFGALLVFLFSTYPAMKRLTYWPQAYLGICWNLGAFIGFAAAHSGSLNLSVVIPLYIFGFFWTIFVDTIYAHQDKLDDIKAGVKSTALLLGNNTPLWLFGFGLAAIANLALAGYNSGSGWAYYGGMLLTAVHFTWQVGTDLDNPDDCNAKFQSNIWLGAWIFGGIVFDKLLTS